MCEKHFLSRLKAAHVIRGRIYEFSSASTRSVTGNNYFPAFSASSIFYLPPSRKHRTLTFCIMSLFPGPHTLVFYFVRVQLLSYPSVVGFPLFVNYNVRENNKGASRNFPRTKPNRIRGFYSEPSIT